MRILLISDVYPPLIGGVERQMQLLGKQLLARGHTLSVATMWQVGLPEQEDDEGIEVHRLRGLSSRVRWFSTNPQRRHHPPLPDPEVVLRLRRVIDRFRPDVIHCYGWIVYSCAVALAGRDVPLLLSVREYAYTCALRTMLRNGRHPCDGPGLLKCLQCSGAHYGAAKGGAAALGIAAGRSLLSWKVRGIHSVSTYMQGIIRRDLPLEAGWAKAGGRQPRPHHVIPSFRDPRSDGAGEGAEVAACLAQLPDVPFILFVGALRLVKGLEPLLAAYQRLTSPPPLVLIGPRASDTPARFPANVVVCYDFPHRAVMAAWERALFGVAPSIWPEPFGSVIHEGMSRGRAFIGTTPSGQTDMIVHGETGLLVPPNDVPGLAAAMQRLLDDAALRERLGRSGRERAALFTAERVVPQFEGLYQQMQAERGGATVQRGYDGGS